MENRSLSYMLFSFQGRMSRSEYWLRYVVPLLLLYVGLLVLLLVIALVFGLVQTLMMTASSLEQGGSQFGALQIVGVIVMMLTVFASSIAFLWAGIASAVKRLHDCNRTGWFYLLVFIPGIGPLLMLIWLGFIRGTVGENKFGPDPNDLLGDKPDA
ncbi:MAG: hypothetical protein CME00_03095 [Geminicoccus sp.]|nr:hypothetical protein [Geminicoccus sp.]|tara:strand:+ start:667 stop:1134 length:468 start_codon:yes stop_codon:yes gene_type:complete